MDRRPDHLDTADLTAAFARLPLQRQTALEHVARRRILRQLHGHEAPQAAADLAAHERLPLSSVSYHARVLSACGLIGSATTRQVRGTAQDRFVSMVREDRSVRSVLDVTEASDGGP